MIEMGNIFYGASVNGVGMLTSRELKTFISVAEKMSIKLAAEELNITPPAVCSMIKKFESRINNRLFIFENNKMVLTQYGERIYSLTKMHYHTLKAIECSIKSDRESIKVFINDEFRFLSSFIESQFKIREREIILTPDIDESTDLIINNVQLLETDVHNYNVFCSSVILYLVQAEVPMHRDIFIYKGHAHLMEDKLKRGSVTEVGCDYRITVLDNIEMIIDIVMNNLGGAILPHTCSVLKCLASSRREFNVENTGIDIPMYVYVHGKVDCNITNTLFEYIDE
ncbi:LysR family transcriptional regulator [Enterobacter sp. WCHEn045836]|uniref:helix-turn-helix domain-containing protein n=1 Tax=Enterobacter sp. WCHEn045836 TaxID=2497434 RepID=UPI0021AD53F5|nr:LysR family transcriptional regulator [Enterobacter sp. WCHEn045836]